MSIFKPNTLNRVLTNDTFIISKEAKEARALDKSIIDATIGALYDNERRFYSYKTILSTIRSLEPEEYLSYTGTKGTPLFSNNIKSWVFGPHLDLINNKYHVSVIPTLGGTGALHNIFVNTLYQDDYLIIPNIHWTNYDVMVNHLGAKVKEYEMFIDNKFNLTALFNAVNDVLKENKKIVCLFNDPAHNPTGYSLSIKEWVKIYQFLNKLSDKGHEIVIIYDIAYFDYDSIRLNDSRKLFKLLPLLNSKITLYIAFSGSKSLSCYGIRIGAEIILSQNQEQAKTLTEMAYYSARATFSVPTSLSIRIIEKVFDNGETRIRFTRELKKARNMLKKRANQFIYETKTNYIDYYPYHGGFFITIKSKNPKEDYTLLKNNGIYTIPVENGLRIAISSIEQSNIKKLVLKINKLLFS